MLPSESVDLVNEKGMIDWGFSECYRKSYDLKTPESNAHPAKMSMQLCFKILKKLMKDGKLKYGDTVLDFMAGIGTTAICWLYMHPSNRVITVELEPHFIKMQEDNKEYLKRKLGRKVTWEIIQGDARQLSKILLERELIGVVSPVYGEAISKQGGECHLKHIGISQKMARQYSSNPKNIGNLPDRIVGITSPPYLEAQSGGGIAKEGYRGKHIKEMGKNQPYKVGEHCGYMKDAHGKSPDNIANLPDKVVGIISPPYPDQKRGNKEGTPSYDNYVVFRNRETEINKNPSNIDNLPDRIVGVVSPPYEKSEGQVAPYKFRDPDKFAKISSERFKLGLKKGHYASPEAIRRSMERSSFIPDSEGQIAQEQGKTYLSAMQEVYEEAAKCCSVLVTVTKNPTRQGKLRRLDIDTRKLCEGAGYQTYDYVRAHLFEEAEQATLDGKIKKIPKGRLGFFKRLQYQKSDRKTEIAKWEDILFFERDSLEAFL